ncbi:MAG: M23 family metallopeptidase [Candidatus Margulisbacteria bacterium]|nr:M23 family metallopeptidase [Candidatus Margulisiibacteriota bacterium]MBU1021356.1 M23 family metallopeptidase [Candidatus Margulisiibacteriota bacterium]MBU1729155.1 M23 family metallopeptidase [Candidatus Margulisiibacteriota bacterium]MBU1954828.1 M23 family metallopeptidase [Candidatus Margulisiibacteriota bacterium]
MKKIALNIFHHHFHLKVSDRQLKIYPARLALFTVTIMAILFCFTVIVRGCIIAGQPQYEIIEGTITSGKPFYISLQEGGISHESILELTESLKGILDFGNLRLNETFKIYRRKDGVIHKFIYIKGPFDQYYSVRDKGGELSTFKPAIYLKKKVYAKEFTLKSSLFETMLAGGEKPALIMEYVNIFSWDIDFFTFPRAGDKIKIIFEKYEQDGEFVKYGKILAAQYITSSKTFSGIYYEPEKGKYGYYDLDGKPVEKQFLKSPLKFTGRITSYFSYSRFHPVVKRNMAHYGVDFASYYGAPIVAAASGKVTFTGWKGAYGYAVMIRHANGYKTLYGHCSKMLTYAGAYVNQGQTIALVGSTGWSTGPHVHYGMYINDVPLNPLTITNKPKGKPLQGQKLAYYNVIKNKYLKELEALK